MVVVDSVPKGNSMPFLSHLHSWHAAGGLSTPNLGPLLRSALPNDGLRTSSIRLLTAFIVFLSWSLGNDAKNFLR